MLCKYAALQAAPGKLHSRAVAKALFYNIVCFNYLKFIM